MHILIIEDNQQLAHCLSRELASEGFTVEIALTGAEGLQRISEAYSEDKPTTTQDPTKIDALVIDWDLPDLSGLEIYERLARHPHRPPALMLTGRDRVEDRVEALNRGFDDYLIKPFSFDELAARIRAISRRQTGSASPASRQNSPLSSREHDVLDLIAAGKSNAEIATDLFLSIETVKSHVKAILTKLNAKDRTHALVIALEQGIAAVPGQGQR